MSEPVESMFGYHIIKADKVGKDADEKEIAELKKMMYDTKLRPAMQQWVTKVTANVKMDNLILPDMPTPPAPGPGGQMMPPQRPQPRPAPQNNKINEQPKEKDKGGSDVELPPAPPAK